MLTNIAVNNEQTNPSLIPLNPQRGDKKNVHGRKNVKTLRVSLSPTNNIAESRARKKNKKNLLKETETPNLQIKLS